PRASGTSKARSPRSPTPSPSRTRISASCRPSSPTPRRASAPSSPGTNRRPAGSSCAASSMTSITDAFARFEQVERSLDELEGKAEVYDLGRKATLGEELAGLEAESGIEDELAALKKRMGNSI